MRLTNRLLAGTALGLLTLSAGPSLAQDTGVMTAYQAFVTSRLAIVDAQSNGGDVADAMSKAQLAETALSEACLAVGMPDLANCLDQNIPADQRLPGDVDLLLQAAAAADAAAGTNATAGQSATSAQPVINGDLQASATADQTSIMTAYGAYVTARQAVLDAQATPDGGATQFLMQAEAAKKALEDACTQAGAADLSACLSQYVPDDQRMPGDLDPLPAPQGQTETAPSGSAPGAAPAASDPAAASSASGTTGTESSATPSANENAQTAPAAPAPAPAEAPAAAPAPAPAEASAPAASSTSVDATATPQSGANVSTSTQANSSADLTDAYKAYVAARKDYDNAMANGGDAAKAANAVNGSFARVVSICQELGVSDVSACLDQYIAPDLRIGDDTKGVIPPAPAAEATTSTDNSASTQPKPDQVNAKGEVLEPVPAEANGKAVPAQEVAPLLDSAKEPAAAATAQPVAPAPNTQQAPTPATKAADKPAPAPAPTSDQQAQADATQQTVPSSRAEKGEKVVGTRATGPVEAAPANSKVLDQNGLRIVFQLGDQLYVRNNDQARLQYNSSDRYIERLSQNRTRETVVRKDGSQVVTIYNSNGDILQRSLFDADGTEYVMVYTPENRQQALLQWSDPAQDLPPLQLNIPASDYVLDARTANEKQVATFLEQPPVEKLRHLYSVDEVKRSARLRDMVRRLEVSDLTFDFGRATVAPDQVGTLTKVANAMLDLLRRNPAETFLIEGHTDAVGSDVSNLELSDRRAEAVANILTQVFGVPPENLATQGYGERYLKVRTQKPERANRRVTIKRVTPLVSPAAG